MDRTTTKPGTTSADFFRRGRVVAQSGQQRDVACRNPHRLASRQPDDLLLLEARATALRIEESLRIIEPNTLREQQIT